MFDFNTTIDRRFTDSIKWAEADGKLAMGLADMDFRAAPAIIEALQTRIDHGVFGYTEVGSGVLDAVAAWSETRRGWTVDHEWLTMCPGIIPSLAHLLRGTLEPGSAAIVQTPAFSPIVEVIEQNGFRVVENPLLLVDGRYEMDFEGLRSAAERPDAHTFVLCSPHNPIGRVWTLEELETTAEICAANDLTVISDEIHAEVIFPWAEFVTYGLAARQGDRHAVLFGPSKGFNLPALRTAIAAIPHDELRTSFRLELHKVNEDFGINAMGAAAVEAAYGHSADWLNALIVHLETNVELLTTTVQDALPRVTVIRPDASFLVWLDCRGIGPVRRRTRGPDRQPGGRRGRAWPGAPFRSRRLWIHPPQHRYHSVSHYGSYRENGRRSRTNAMSAGHWRHLVVASQGLNP